EQGSPWLPSPLIPPPTAPSRTTRAADRPTPVSPCLPRFPERRCTRRPILPDVLCFPIKILGTGQLREDLSMSERDDLGRAAAAIAGAEALIIGAGAGMGVDSGLPDFRGTEGFWKAYPPFAKLGLNFVQLANPRWFRTDPTLA